MGSAVVIEVPEAERFVGEHRHALDPVATRGVPAHVTVLYPFRSELDAAADAAVAAIASRTAPFVLTFGSARSFPDGVVYLAPTPDDPIRRLVHEFVDAFPDCPPYGGTVGDPTPHLTVGHGLGAEAAGRLVAELSELPPITTTVEGLAMLVEGADGRWTVERRWPLTGIDE